MEDSLAKGKSLIENVKCGASIEFDRRTRPDYAFNVIKTTLANLGLVQGNKERKYQTYYHVYGVMLKEGHNDINLRNFKKTIIDGETFYPILYGEKAYPDLLCLKAKKIK